MFQVLPKANKSVIVGQLLTGVLFLSLISTAFAAQPRIGRMSRTAATAPTRPNVRSEPRQQLRLLDRGLPHGIPRPFTGGTVRPPERSPSTKPPSGNNSPLGPVFQLKPACPKTRLQIQMEGDNSKWKWVSVVTFQSPTTRLFRWKTGESSAVGIRWHLYDNFNDTQTPAELATPVIGTGFDKYPDGPARDEWVYFSVDLSQFLPAEVLRHKNYWLHVVPIGEQNQTVGAPSPVVRMFHKHPPADLAATSCQIKDGDHWNYDFKTVECRAENVGKYVYEGHRTYYIKQYYPTRVLKTGVIPAGLKPGEAYTTSILVERPGGDTFFAFGLSHDDQHPGNDGATTKP